MKSQEDIAQGRKPDTNDQGCKLSSIAVENACNSLLAGDEDQYLTPVGLKGDI